MDGLEGRARRVTTATMDALGAAAKGRAAPGCRSAGRRASADRDLRARVRDRRQDGVPARDEVVAEVLDRAEGVVLVHPERAQLQRLADVLEGRLEPRDHHGVDRRVITGREWVVARDEPR